MCCCAKRKKNKRKYKIAASLKYIVECFDAAEFSCRLIFTHSSSFMPGNQNSFSLPIMCINRAIDRSSIFFTFNTLFFSFSLLLLFFAFVSIELSSLAFPCFDHNIIRSGAFSIPFLCWLKVYVFCFVLVSIFFFFHMLNAISNYVLTLIQRRLLVIFRSHLEKKSIYCKMKHTFISILKYN